MGRVRPCCTTVGRQLAIATGLDRVGSRVCDSYGGCSDPSCTDIHVPPSHCLIVVESLGKPSAGWRLRLYTVIFEADTRAGRLFDKWLIAIT